MSAVAKKIATIVRCVDRAREEHAGAADSELSDRLQRMIGFRNIAVHDYQALNLDIVEAVIEKHLGDLLAFAEAMRPHLAGKD